MKNSNSSTKKNRYLIFNERNIREKSFTCIEFFKAF